MAKGDSWGFLNRKKHNIGKKHTCITNKVQFFNIVPNFDFERAAVAGLHIKDRKLRNNGFHSASINISVLPVRHHHGLANIIIFIVIIGIIMIIIIIAIVFKGFLEGWDSADYLESLESFEALTIEIGFISAFVIGSWWFGWLLTNVSMLQCSKHTWEATITHHMSERPQTSLLPIFRNHPDDNVIIHFCQVFLSF